MSEGEGKVGKEGYLYELAWILPSVALPVGMMAALLVTAFGAGIHLPTKVGRVDPARLHETAPFDRLGVVEVGPNEFEARLVGQIWTFMPGELRVPRGATVHFVATSRAVVHGLFIHGANVNLMLIPGQISRVTTRFEHVGEFPFVCHEYCGASHHTMWGKVVVEDRPAQPMAGGSQAEPPIVPAKLEGGSP